MTGFETLVASLHERRVRFIVIGVWGANLYAHEAGALFTTQDRDIFLPPESDNLLRAWDACEAFGLSLWSGGEPLDAPRDHNLANVIVSRRALVRATDQAGLQVDLTLVMAGFEFEAVWRERRSFVVGGIDVPVARLSHIVQSKAAAGREKDRLFLATHADVLKQLLQQGD